MNTANAVEQVDVVIIGAGPSGSVAASLLKQQGVDALVLERAQFPRFSIGESLLPCCMTVLEQAGMTEAVAEAGFQFKNGAAFGATAATPPLISVTSLPRAPAPPFRFPEASSTSCWPTPPVPKG